MGNATGFSGRQSSGRVGHPGAGGRRADHRTDGALRVGADSRARHSGSDRIDSDQRKPGPAEAGHPEAAVLGHLDRLRRSVRRRRSHHHDRRRIRVDDRAILPSDWRRAEDPAGGGRRRRDVGDFCRADGRPVAGGGAIVVRMEAAQRDSGGAGQRNRGGFPLVHPGRRAIVSGPRARGLQLE